MDESENVSKEEENIDVEVVLDISDTSSEREDSNKVGRYDDLDSSSDNSHSLSEKLEREGQNSKRKSGESEELNV